MKHLAIMSKLTLYLLVSVSLLNLASVEGVIGQLTSETNSDIETRKTASVEAEYEAIVRRFYEAVFNRGNLDRVDQIIASNYVEHNPPGLGLTVNIGGLKQVLTLFSAAFPDFHYTIEEIIVKGDKVVCRITIHGTQKGKFLGIAPTGKQVMVTGIDIFRITDGVIVERWGTFHGMVLMQLLGVIDPTVWKRTLSIVEEKKGQVPDGRGEVFQGSDYSHQMQSKKLSTLDTSESQKGAYSSQVINLDSLDQLKGLFQDDSGQVRLIALLSPN